MKKIQGCNILADLAFNDNYKKIILPVQKDLELFEETILKYFSKHEKEQKGEYSQILPIIKEFLSNKGKRLRPVLIFLFARALGNDVTYEEVLKDLRERDYKDVHREHGAIKLLPDSIIIDTTNQSLEQSVDFCIKEIKKKYPDINVM